MAICTPSEASKAAHKRYLRLFGPMMLGYVLSVIVISWVMPIDQLLPIWPRRLACLVPVLFIVGTIYAMGRYVDEEPDEFRRLVQVRAMLAATAVVLVAGTAWGFLQEYGGLSPFPVIILFPVWCGAWAVTSVWAGRKYR